MPRSSAEPHANWIGAGFVPGAKIDDILRVVHDYDRYKEVYRPGVIDSISHGRDGDNTGTGLIWRLSSITRLEERDGGVYAELEALALSRDIPAALRLFVTPIVRRVCRDSQSLHQTRVAINASMERPAANRPAQ